MDPKQGEHTHANTDTSKYTIIKFVKTTEKEYLKRKERKKAHYLQRNKVKITADFSFHNVSGQWNDIFKVLKGKRSYQSKSQ